MYYISQKKLFKYALYCNSLYVFLLFLFRPNGITPEKLIISSFLAFSVLGVFVFCLKNIKDLKGLSKNTRRIFFFLMFWSIITVTRSLSLNIQDVVTNFGNVYMALAWFTPLLIIAGQKLENWRIIFKVLFFMFKLMLFSALFLPFYVGSGKLKTEWSWLMRPVNFLLLIGVKKFNASNRLIFYCAFILYIIIAILTEQRLEFVYLALLIVILFIDNIIQIKIKRKFLKFIFFSIVLVTILIFTYGYENLNTFLVAIVEFQDTRVFLYNELFQDLNLSEQLFGRGSLGKYYSHFMEHTKHYTINVLNEPWWGDSPDRITIEVGYLQMILKGGMILFLLSLFFMLKSSYLAIFKSNNIFVKRLGIYIFIITALSLISFRPAFTPTFILLWMAIGTVLNKENRLMSNEEVNQLIKN